MHQLTVVQPRSLIVSSLIIGANISRVHSRALAIPDIDIYNFRSRVTTRLPPRSTASIVRPASDFNRPGRVNESSEGEESGNGGEGEKEQRYRSQKTR